MVIIFIVIITVIKTVQAGPQSTTYELKEYGFGAGGTDGSTSPSYSMFGVLGEVDSDTLSSATFRSGNGLVFTLQSNVPATPGFTNPGNTYDRLQITLDTGSNSTDTKFAIAISTDNFATTSYIQSDNTVGAVLGTEDWQTNTIWGASGFFVTGLAQNTTYKIKVKAKQGNFTESQWSQTATATTSVPSLTFNIDSSSIAFNNLNSSNSYTDSSKSTVITTSTNAYNGYIVYGHDNAPLTYVATGSTIPQYSSPNSSPTTWSGNGFGYTTSDSSLTGGTADRFTNGGSKYAGFTVSNPGDPVADHPGPITSPITSEQFTISYRVTANAQNTAGNYRTSVLYVVVPTY